MTIAKADVRSGWNAVERLAELGDMESARWLAALLSEASILMALALLAEKTNLTGRMLLAMESAEQMIADAARR